MVVIQGIVDCTLYAPQIGLMFIFIGAITYNEANCKIIKDDKF